MAKQRTKPASRNQETAQEPTPETASRARDAETSGAGSAAAESSDAGTAPPETAATAAAAENSGEDLPSTAAETNGARSPQLAFSLEFPECPGESLDALQRRHVDVQLNRLQRYGWNAIVYSLDHAKAKLANGTRVATQRDAVRWIGEQAAAQVELHDEPM